MSRYGAPGKMWAGVMDLEICRSLMIPGRGAGQRRKAEADWRRLNNE
jgi:hypothetical protein